jgi:hypothetical protein
LFPRALSDEKYQEFAWIRGKFPEGIEYDNFDLAVHFLFDDTCLAEQPEDLIGYCLINKQEAQLVHSVTEPTHDAFFRYIDNTDYSLAKFFPNSLTGFVSALVFYGCKFFLDQKQDAKL